MSQKSLVDDKRALAHLMDLLAVEGLSGQEKNIAELVKKKLRAAGCKPAWMKHDNAHKKIDKTWQVGNLIVRMPGTIKGPRQFFMGHLDTVPLCRGAVPQRKGNRIVSKGATALGGDNRTAVACLVTLAETLLENKIPHPPTTLLFTVGEEVGLFGARYVKLSDLGNPVMGFNIDSGDPRSAIIGAIGAERWDVHVRGRSSHAGVHPEDGVSAALIASMAIAEVAEKGYFGRVIQGKQIGTSNVGVITGGEATNQVTDYVYVKGESRSHNFAFCARITNVYRKAFERAAKKVKNSSKVHGRIEFNAERDYDAFKMSKTSAPVKATVKAIENLGWKADLKIAGGGLDANYLNAKGVPTVTLGAGQHNAHTVDEYIDVKEYIGGCQLAVEIAGRES